ncbi:hypothetical protein GQ600_24409 [Phytophthora cactorum]|nr:hypothetical protein GQ600_24409 [Phytophthora cactorum]
MTTQATSEATSAPNSPSFRAGTAPSGIAAPASRADVVDVTGGDKPWTATSARSTTAPPPLRTSNRAAYGGWANGGFDAALVEMTA